MKVVNLKKEKYCKDCNKKLNSKAKYHNTKRCSSCEMSRRHRIKKLYIPSNYIDGRKLRGNNCLDCRKKIGYKSKRCQKCYHIYRKPLIRGKNNPNFGKKFPQLSGKNNSRFGKKLKPNWGEYRGILMRSNWEMLFAQFLYLSGYKWKYEPKVFDLGNTTYTPDFYIPEWDLYIEIKGYSSDVFKKKFDLFKKIYLNIRTEIFTKMHLENIGVLK